MFFKGSRYESVPTRQYEDATGRVISYKALRIVPSPHSLAAHVVDEGERLDHIAFSHYRDSERFWRICDANLAIEPESLVEFPGDVIDIPPADG